MALSREDLDSSVNSLEFGLKYSIYDFGLVGIELYNLKNTLQSIYSIFYPFPESSPP